MFLLKDYYTPVETIEIINNRLNPIPKMEIEHLVSIVEKEALYLYAQSNLGAFKVKEGFFTFLHESADRWRYKGAGLLLAHQLMSDHRKNWNEVLPAPRYADSDNELKEIPVLWDAVFKRADIESFIENTLAKKEEPIPKATTAGGEDIKPIKSKPEMLRKWMVHVITVEKGLSLSDEMPDGLQAQLIERAREYGYIDGTAVKKAWSALGLQSARKTVKMKKPPKTP